MLSINILHLFLCQLKKFVFLNGSTAYRGVFFTFSPPAVLAKIGCSP